MAGKPMQFKCSYCGAWSGDKVCPDCKTKHDLWYVGIK